MPSTQTAPSPYVDNCGSGKVNFFQRYDNAANGPETGWFHRTGTTAQWKADMYEWWRNHADRGQGSEPALYAAPSGSDPGGYYQRALVYTKSYGIPTSTTTISNPYVLRSTLDHSKPAYLNYSCTSGGTCSQYAGDIANPGFRAQRIQEMFASYDAGWYKGLWIDDVPTRSMTTDGSNANPANGLGSYVRAYSPYLGRELTDDDWRIYTKQLMTDIRAFTYTEGGVTYSPFARGNAELLINVKWDPNVAGGGMAGTNVQGIVGQADYVDLEGMSYDTNHIGGTGTTSFNNIRDYVKRIHDVGTAVVWDDFLHTATAEEYGIAQMLLSNAGNDAVGINNQTPLNWWDAYDYDLGKATTHLPTVTGNLVRRNFTNGTVLAVDPDMSGGSTGTPASVTLDRDYIDTSGALLKSGTTISITPRTAKILRVPGSTGTLAGARRADFLTVNGTSSYDVSLTTRRGVAGKVTRANNITGTRGTFVADTTGDGMDEVTALDTNGAVRVYKVNGSIVSAPSTTPILSKTTTLPAANVGTFFADVTGDKKADLVSWSKGSTTVDFTVIAGGSPSPITSTIDPTFFGDKLNALVDVTGDKRADLVAVSNDGTVKVAASNVSSFAAPVTYVSSTAFTGTTTATTDLVCDVNGDGKADFVSINGSTIKTAITNTAGTGAAAPTTSTGTFTPGEAGSKYSCADFNGDGKADIVSWGSRILLTTNGYTSGTVVPFSGTKYIGPADPLNGTTQNLLGEFDGE